MAFEVVHGEERDVFGGGDGFAGHHADHNAANKTGAAGCGDGVYIVQGGVGVFEGGFNEGVEMVDMGAGGDFGYNAAKNAVFFELAENQRGEDALACGLACVYYRGCGFIARCFYAEDFHGRFINHEWTRIHANFLSLTTTTTASTTLLNLFVIASQFIFIILIISLCTLCALWFKNSYEQNFENRIAGIAFGFAAG